jgi:hypothetical protein
MLTETAKQVSGVTERMPANEEVSFHLRLGTESLHSTVSR